MKTPEKVAASVIRSITDIEAYGWPPICNGLFYQPERPVRSCEKAENTAAEKEASITK